MRQAAEAAGVGYDWFRKTWPALVKAEGFPPPFLGRRWDAAAVAAWRARRSDPRAWRGAETASAAGSHAPSPRAVERARAALEALRSEP